MEQHTCCLCHPTNFFEMNYELQLDLWLLHPTSKYCQMPLWLQELLAYGIYILGVEKIKEKCPYGEGMMMLDMISL